MIIGLHILIVNYYVELNIFGKQGSPNVSALIESDADTSTY